MSFNYNFPISVFPNISFNIRQKSAIASNKAINEGYVSNPILDQINLKSDIEKTIKTNSRIAEIMKEYHLPICINIEALTNLKYGHMNDTRRIVTQIYSALPSNIRQNIDLQDLQTAAILHDFGKVLIPQNILCKSGKLNVKEREIMELHSELGYELLKNKGLNQNILNLIKYHHQNIKGEGYPLMKGTFAYSIDAQILSVADKYSALREKRSYKNPMGKYEALEIIAQDVNKGNISQDVYTALMRSV